MSLNLAVILTESARRYPCRPAVILGDRKVSYSELDAASNKVANGLARLGVKPGDRVALMIPNLPHFPIIYYGILKLGAIVVPLNVLLKAGEIAYHLSDSDTVAMFVWQDFAIEAVKGVAEAPNCRDLFVATSPGGTVPEGATSLEDLMAPAASTFPLLEMAADDTAVILYTSGTTGRPKGAELTHFNMFFNAYYCSHDLIAAKPEDVSLGSLPFFHSFGQTCVMNAMIAVGGTVTCLPRFDPVAAFETIERDRVTILAGVPTMYFYLLNLPGSEKYDLSSIRLAISGGAAMPVEVLHAFERRYNCPILEGYGLSETSPVASFNVRDRERRPGSIGLPIWGVSMRVFDDDDQEMPNGEVGEIVIRGHNVMKGYYRRAEATAKTLRHGWFHTGDLAKVDDEGYFYIVDRKKDMVIRGGFNVYPREIEEVLYSHPAVAEAAVIGVTDPALGEEVKAVVALKEGSAVTADELMAFCKERTAAYKYPRIIEIVPALPKGPTGKILKCELR